MIIKRPMRLGFGATGAWASTVICDDQARDVLRTALEHGVRDIDTAGFYVGGRAELRLGALLGGVLDQTGVTRDEIRLSTKVGKKVGIGGRLIRDFDPGSVLQSIKASLARLGAHALDVVYVHGPNKHELSSTLPPLIKAKEFGRIKAIGVCSEGANLASAKKRPEVDAIMGRYNLLHRYHRRLFAEARRDGQQVVAIAPLAQGLWRRDFRDVKRRSDIWYLARAALRNRREWQAAQDELAWVHDVPGWTALEVVLAFVRLNADIQVVMTTTTQPDHMRELAEAFRKPITKDVVEVFRAHSAARHAPNTDAA